MRALAIHTCPVWERADGSRVVGFDQADDELAVVGWCNVLVAQIGDTTRALLLAI